MDVRRGSARRVLLVVLALAAGLALPPAPVHGAEPAYDPALARELGADERGMRAYVLVILKTGPNEVPAGPERETMFKGHFANINRLANEGKLVLAGPLDGVDGWRGLFVFAVKEIDEAKRHVATDPVIRAGEMVAEYHQFYGSAALMKVTELHVRLVPKP